jgi:hypothetical protein
VSDDRSPGDYRERRQEEAERSECSNALVSNLLANKDYCAGIPRGEMIETVEVRYAPSLRSQHRRWIRRCHA